MINEMSVVECARMLCGGKAAELVRDHVKRANKALRALHRAEAQGDRAGVRELQIRFLRSYSAKLCATVLNAEADAGHTWESLQQVAEELDPFSDPGEAVKAWAKVKSSSGDWRPICEFGLQRGACQSLIGFVLDARFGTHPLDYMAAGRGADVTADRISELADDGFEWFVLADIENNFGSINMEEAAEILHLPQTVVTHCLSIREEVPLTVHIPWHITPLAFSEAVRQGLPQGARSANRVMARLLGPKIEALPPFEQGLFYGDDIAMAASSRKKAEAAAKALQEMLTSHPAGPFRLKRLEVRSVFEGFEFAKYRIRRDPIDGHMKITPASKSYKKFRDKVREIIRDEAVSEVYARVMGYRARWLAAFPRYERTVEQEALALISLWQSVIESLSPVYRRKWERACDIFLTSGKPAPETCDDWLSVGNAPALADS